MPEMPSSIQNGKISASCDADVVCEEEGRFDDNIIMEHKIQKISFPLFLSKSIGHKPDLTPQFVGFVRRSSSHREVALRRNVLKLAPRGQKIHVELGFAHDIRSKVKRSTEG